MRLADLIRVLWECLARLKPGGVCRTCGTSFTAADAPFQTRSGQCCFCAQVKAPLTSSVRAKGAPMGSGPQPPILSPHAWWEGIDTAGRRISISLRFDNVTRAMLGADVHRDPDCSYSRILIGLGADGQAESSPNIFTVPAGDTVVAANALRRNGLDTVEDVLALQITAGA